MSLPTLPQVTLPAGLESIEGIEAVLQTLMVVLKEILPDKLDEIEAEWADIENLTLADPDTIAYAVVNDEDTYPDEDEIEAEWADIENLTLDDPDTIAYAVVNDEDTYPDEDDSLPSILIMGIQDLPDELYVDNPEIDLYTYECAIRVWLRGNVAPDMTRRVFRYGDAIKRVLKYVGDGTYDADGNQHIVWTIRNIAGRYSSVSPVSPYYQAAQIDFQVRVFREW